MASSYSIAAVQRLKNDGGGGCMDRIARGTGGLRDVWDCDCRCCSENMLANDAIDGAAVDCAAAAKDCWALGAVVVVDYSHKLAAAAAALSIPGGPCSLAGLAR